ncbi:hypothetical protein [Pandoraea sputorum]|uniref:Uncharacterized protein n=1 Tax=Pandoraea sputorum TaxID=93222 RepID=A0A239SPM3_9BURK|nr:hypothetical protein [Pandoraea sputorum]AJC18135.1 hypothetical protein NA29_23225 [Pandoraea sputorum]SNU87415.1 Uncharacterised protein [Pandoraea sputorum]VVE51107.1 hypothetical protein PSP20601_04685 [Pandoraea sputorum]
MQRPALVTVIGYLQFIAAITSVQMFQEPLVGKVAIFPGSWLSVHAQWNYLAYSVLLNLITGFSILRGYRFAPWLLAMANFAGFSLMIPSFSQTTSLSLLSAAYSVVTVAPLFLAPSAKQYFRVRRTVRAKFSVRDILSTLLQILAAFTIHRQLIGGFTHVFEPWAAGVAIVFVSGFAILIGSLIRWRFWHACSDFAITLVTAGIFSGYMLLVSASVWPANPDGQLFERLQIVAINFLLLVAGIGLARLSTRRIGVARAAMPTN